MRVFLLVLSMLIGLVSYTQDCKYLYNEYDQSIGILKIVLKSEKVLCTKDIDISVSVARIDDRNIIYWSFMVNNSYAYSNYGYLKSGNKIILNCNEDTIELDIFDSSSGRVNYQYNYTLYSVHTVLSDNDVDILSSEYINSIDVYWTELYKCYNIEDRLVIFNQLKCIKN